LVKTFLTPFKGKKKKRKKRLDEMYSNCILKMLKNSTASNTVNSV